MTTMTKKSSGRPKNPEGRARPGKKNLNAWVDEAIREAVDRAILEIRPKTNLTAVAEDALTKWLSEHGYWPPPEQ